MGDCCQPHHLAQLQAARQESAAEDDDRPPWPAGPDPVCAAPGKSDAWRGSVSRTQLAAVMARVEQAFADVPMPDGVDLFVDEWVDDHLNPIPTRWCAVLTSDGSAALDGLIERDALYCSWLRPEAYRYALPILLRGCLLGTNDYAGRWHALEPREEVVLAHGSDPLLDARIDLLTPEQRAAVCDVMGLRLRAVVGPGDPVTVAYLAGGVVEAVWASDPLRLGWSRVDHPAVALAQAVRRRWTTFIWPECDSQPERDLITQVREAFADRPRPAGPLYVGDDYEAVDNALALAGTDWRHVHPELLHWANTALVFLDAEAVCYYLPAYLIGDLMRVGPDVVFSLTSVIDPHVSGWMRANMDLLSRAERAAVVAYLRHEAGRDGWDAFSIQVALDEYWLRER